MCVRACVCACVCVSHVYVHRLFFKDMQHKALEKKSNIEYLEQIGWQQFLPKFVIEGVPVCYYHLLFVVRFSPAFEQLWTAHLALSTN